MKKLFILPILVFIYFPAYSQPSMFQGGKGGGSDKAQIRKQTILSVENEQEEVFFEQIKIISQSNSFLIEWNDKIKLEQIEIIDVLGRVQKLISISEFQKTIFIDFDRINRAKGIYFIRFRDNKDRFFSEKIIY